MKKKFAAALFVCAVMTSGSSCAFADFLCMRSDETIAITNDENGDLQYAEMRDSKGALVAPIISSDGNTYLPLRYICDITGIADGNSVQGELGDNCYRFVDNDDYDRIEITCNGKYYSHRIGENFTYTAADGTVRTVAIYNIRGTLYAPMGYLASITGAQAVWDERFSRIMFIGADIDRNEYLNADNTLRRDREMKLGHEIFNNNLTDLPFFLSTDGMTIIKHFDENIFRTNNQNFSLRVLTSQDKSTALCHSMFGIKNRVYGIDGKPYGKLFTCDVTGGDFRYLTEKDVYNPIVVNTDLEYTIYYCDADTRSTLHMIRENTMDDYEIQITDFEHNNLLPEIKQFAVGLKNVYCLDTSGNFHVIDLDFPLTQVPIARLKSGSVIHTHAADGTALDNITSMNYDHINDVVYITQTEEDNRIYTYSPLTRQFNHLVTLEGEISGLALFYDASYTNRLAVMTENGIYDVRTEFNNGIVTVKE